MQRIVEHIGIEDGVLGVHLDRAPAQELDHIVVDLYFDGENFILNEINVGNIGGFINYDRVYPDRKGMLAEALSRRLVKRAADYERNVKRLRRWERAGTPTVGTEVEIVLTKIGKDGHRRQMTPAEAGAVLERCPAAKNEPSIALDSSGGIETNSGSGTMYDIKDETARFARNCCTLLKCLNEVIASLQGTEDEGSILISCTGQYSSGIHLNMRKPLYGQDVEPNETAEKDYHRIKRILPIISGLSTNPSEGLWHPLTRRLKSRQVFEFFNIRRYGEIVYNTRHSEAGMPPRLEIRPPDTSLHPAYVGLYYALIYSALAGKTPQELSFEEYHKAFCNGAMDNLRGSVLCDGERVSLAEALNRFYNHNKDIFEELELDAAHQELLDAARLNGFTYKDFNDAVGRIVDEVTFLRFTLEIFTRACCAPQRTLSDIIRDSLADAGKTFGASDSQREAILELSDMFAYRPRNLASQDKEELPPAIETIEQDRGISLRVITETGSFCAVTLTRINGKGIIEFVGEETAERGMLDVLIKKVIFQARALGLRSVEVYLKPGQRQTRHFLLDYNFFFKRIIPGNNGNVVFIMSKRLDYDEPQLLRISELPSSGEVMSHIQEGLGIRIEDIAAKPLLLILVPERARKGISRRAPATYVGFMEERNKELGWPFDIAVLDAEQISDPSILTEMTAWLEKTGGVIFNRIPSSRLPQEIKDLLDAHGINSWRFENVPNQMADVLESISGNPELKEYISETQYHIPHEYLLPKIQEALELSNIVLVINEEDVLSEPLEISSDMPQGDIADIVSQLDKKYTYMVKWKIEPLRTIGGKPFIIDAIVQKNHLGQFQVAQRLVRIPKKKFEGRVHVGVTPGYTGRQTL
ncbi:MAG: hypothetical protein AB1530_07685, partial [Candidatus Omnitrophota bacterium]